MDPLELMGFATGAVCVWLAARENIWNWPIGIANNVFYFVVFWRSGLFGDAVLQVFYLLIGIYGWWKWAVGGPAHRELPATRVPFVSGLLLCAFGAAIAAVLYWALRAYTPSTVPAWDAVTTAMSLVAQYMLGRKWLENWVVWISVDVIYIGLYAYKHLYWTSLLYAIFIVMCVIGYRAWRSGISAAVERAGQAAQG